MSILSIARATESPQILAPAGNPSAQPPPPLPELLPQLSLDGRFAALLSGPVLLFAAEDTPHKLSLQVLFFLSVLRMNQVVLGLLWPSALAHRRRCWLFFFRCRGLVCPLLEGFSNFSDESAHADPCF